MASILARLSLMGVRARGFVVILACATTMAWGADVSGNSRPPDEGEIYTLLSDMGTASLLCDHQWFDRHHPPTWTVTYTVEGKPPVTVGRDEMFEWFRKVCTPTYTRPSYDNRSYSVKMEHDRTVVRYRVGKGSFDYFLGARHFLRLKPKEIRSIGHTEVVVRDNDGWLKFRESHVNVERVP